MILSRTARSAAAFGGLRSLTRSSTRTECRPNYQGRFLGLRVLTADSCSLTTRRDDRPAQIERKSWFFTGSARMRWPVAAKIALHNAGASGGTGGAPPPAQKTPLGTIQP